MSDVVSVGGGLWSLVVDGTMVVFSSRHAAEELLAVITERDKEIERLRTALKPFAAVAAGIPDNWPGQCRLTVVYGDYYGRQGHEWLSYAMVGLKSTLPLISEWREAAK